MKIQHLRYVDALARHLTMTRAAKELGVSQPALSQAIRELEAELGVKLLDRSSRSLSFTEAGNQVLEAIQRALAALDKIKTTAENYRNSPTLRLAVTRSMLPMLSPAIGKLMAMKPDLHIQSLDAAGSRSLSEKLLSGSADLCFGNLENAPNGFKIEPTGMVECVLVSPIGTNLPEKVSFSDLDRLPLICVPPCTERSEVLDHTFNQLGMHLNFVLETEDILSHISAIKSGIGSALFWHPLCEFISGAEIRQFEPRYVVRTGFIYLSTSRNMDNIVNTLKSFMNLPEYL